MVATPVVIPDDDQPRRNRITVDFSQANATRQIFPCAPLLSSHKAGWASICLEYHRQPRYEGPVHSCNQHVIAVYTGQPATVKRLLGQRSQTEHLVTGDTLVVPAFVQHQASCDVETEFLLLSIDPGLMSQITCESTTPDSTELVPHFSAADPLVYQIAMTLKAELEFDELSDCLSGEQRSSRLYVDALAHALATHLLRHYSVRKLIVREDAGGLPQQKLKEAIAYIHAYLDQPLSITMIAAVVQISPHYFCRLFKQSTGLAPHQYVIQQRVERAKHLLRQPHSTIADIALECGFSNQAHLTKHFRKLLGVTPRAYRAIADESL